MVIATKRIFTDRANRFFFLDLDRTSYLPRVPTDRNGNSNPASLTRLICGGLILPTIATIFGKFMFQRVHSNFQRTLLVSQRILLRSESNRFFSRVALHLLYWKALRRFIINKVNIFVKHIEKFWIMSRRQLVPRIIILLLRQHIHP